MKQLLEHKYLVQKNVLAIMGLVLCLYFSYHLILGERSYLRYLSLQENIETLHVENKSLKQEREALETRVSMLRPNSLNRDLLEERARIVLGYRGKDEKDILVSR